VKIKQAFQSLPRYLKAIIILAIVTLLLLFLRRPLMLAAGNFLIISKQPETADAIYILSGGPDTRAKEGAKLFFTGFAHKIFCTGENKHEFLRLFDIDLTEAEMTAQALRLEGVPDSVIYLIPRGTSTREEAAIVAKHSASMQFKKVIVVSDMFHTRRIRYVFKPHFSKANIELIIVGAPSLVYNEQLWWANESGLIMVNNEYIKLFYYWLNY
jgi:uncharacterized SAM-binding protein YcdF (DUF218 family)